jgi:transposase
MTQDEPLMAPSAAEVSMVEPDAVRQIRALRDQGWGVKRLAREFEMSRNTVRRYLRGAPEVQVRPRARRMGEATVAAALELFDQIAEGNAVVIAQELARAGVDVSLRTVQRAVAPRRRQLRAAELATCRFETRPGQQMQIDFGQKRVSIAGVEVIVHLLVAVLGYSRRIFVKAFLAERQDEWREGIAAAFVHFGGVTTQVLGDNARALVIRRDPETGAVIYHPGYEQFCRDWDITPRSCAPYRARTKGKTESGVK